MAAKTKFTEGPSAGELIEEAMHLVRQLPASAWAVYLATGGLWGLGVLYFWAHVTWFEPDPGQLSWMALGLLGCFAALKAGQTDFCAQLLALRGGLNPPPRTFRSLLRAGVRQAGLGAPGLFLLPVASVLTIPFPWIWAYFLHLPVAEARGSSLSFRDAWTQACRWPKQNHFGMLFLGCLALVAVFNGFVVVFTLPWLANRWLGISNLFSLSGWNGLNSTVIATTVLVAWLAVDPFVRAFACLRAFYGDAQTTGEDLRLDLVHLRRKLNLPALSVAFLLLATFTARLDAETAPPRPIPTPAPAAWTPPALEREIHQVLEGRDFRWQIRTDERRATPANATWTSRFVDAIGSTISDVIRWIGETWRSFKAWIERVLGLDKDTPSPEKKTDESGSGLPAREIVQVLLYVLLAATAMLLIWILVVSFRRRKQAPSPVWSVQTELKPDLRDEQVTAAALPSDGWLKLAREMIAAGEWRLALRALHLASLAQLAADGWLVLARHKTNLDYERELRRRAAGQATLQSGFRTRRLEFESVWYGTSPAEPEQVQRWLGEMEAKR